MKILLSAPVLTVSNLEISLDYYIEKLGFQLAFSEKTYAGVKRDNAEIHLTLKDGNPRHGQILNPTGKGNFYLICDDAKKYYDSIKQEGGFILNEPKLEGGILGFAVNDPDGNTILIGEDCG